MSMLTRAVVSTHRPAGLRAMAVAGLLTLVLAATGLFLLHVRLRFAISDLKIETRKYQHERTQLESRRNQLLSNLERYKAGERTLDYAREELGMVSYNPAEASTLVVPAARLDAWRKGVAPARETDAGAPSSGAVAGPARGTKQRAQDSFDVILQAFRLGRSEDRPADS